MDGGKHKSSSPVDPPTACGNESESSCRSNSRPPSRHDKPNCPESRTSSGENQSPPACLQWAQSLHFLLQDSDGVKLFMEYLESEGQQHADALHFWFACEGLKNEMEREKIQRLIKVIYNTFFVKSALPINAELLRQIALNLKSPQCISLLEEAQAQIEYLINNTTYPNFLKSDMYLQYLQSVQNPCSISSSECSSDSSSSSSSVSAKELTNLASGLGSLPTLHEDVEFTYNPPVQHVHTPGTGSVSTGYLTPNVSSGKVKLTKDVLLMSQKHRALDVRPKMEAYAGVFMNRGMGAHAAYNSYNPVSRQDSELQSLSSHSDARTESDLSTDGKPASRSSHCRQVLETKLAREYAALNRETDLHQTLIPRTQSMDKRQMPWMDFQQHAAILTKKLENLKREQEKSELLDKKLKEGDLVGSVDDKGRMSEMQTRELANAIRKLQLEDEHDQDILDEHVSRVFSPAGQSPGVISPRLHSPSRSRYLHGSYMRSRRREGDGSSMLSSDSGNIYDFVEGSEHKFSMVKSKSMPEYADDRFSRGSASRRSSSKRTLNDLTDSGVSVLSDTPPVVRSWLMDAERCAGRMGPPPNYPMNEMMRHRGHRTSATSPNASRHRKAYGSRSNSLERGSACGSLGPTQPFVADPSLPPPPRPNPDFQLEEARKRLMEDDFRSKPRQKLSNKYHQEMSLSSQSTLRKSGRGQRPPYGQPPPPEEFTTVIFSFCDEQFPYRSKIPGTQVTLRQFKEYLPKKGNYRFFFKTVSEELDNQVIQEEVSNDSDIIPLWEGKIMAQVKPLD